jgi:DNA-binding MarR family transcriptional regulator
MLIDVGNLLKQNIEQNEKRSVIIRCKKKNLTFYWINKKNGKPLGKNNQPKPIKLPRYIKIDEKAGEIIGLYYGEGTKNENYVEFVNSSVELIKLWIKSLKIFGIKKSDLSFTIKISGNVKKKYNLSEEEIKEFWRNAIRIPSNKKIKIQWVKARGKPSSYLKKYGSLTVRFFNVLFSYFYNLLLKNATQLVFKSFEFATGFLRGIIAAEGNINFESKSKSLSLIRIAGSRDERKFFGKLLFNLLKINTKEDKNNQIYFTGFKNFQKIKKLELFRLDPLKNKLFEIGYNCILRNINRQKDPNVVLKNEIGLRILKLLENSEKSTKEIITMLGLSRDNLKRYLKGYRIGNFKYRGLFDLGLVSYRRNPERRCEKIWKITKAGKTFLRNLKKKLNQPLLS